MTLLTNQFYIDLSLRSSWNSDYMFFSMVKVGGKLPSVPSLSRVPSVTLILQAALTIRFCHFEMKQNGMAEGGSGCRGIQQLSC